MELKHPLLSLVENQKAGIKEGIYSACTASDYVIEAVLERALRDNRYVLIEATANQVNQFGGYTGMKPKDYMNFVLSLAEKINFPQDKIILGGDHLGPLTWAGETAAIAMEKAKELIRDYVLAGFTKIHIDTSMKVADDDKNLPLDIEVIAERGAILCLSGEDAYKELKTLRDDAPQPIYVVGSEVPIPGGSEKAEEGIHVTKVCDFEATIETFIKAFHKYNIDEAWSRVVAVVVQPGVEFGDEAVHQYNRETAKELTSALKNYKGLVFEGHSTDYQIPEALKQMVEDGIAILKVGPALTFAEREGLYALNCIENELFKYNPAIELSHFMDILEMSMVKNPSNWKKHYYGSASKIKYSRKYSYSDRSRYYLPNPDVRDARDLLLANLKLVEIPLTILTQYMPVQYNKIRQGLLKNEPEALLKDRIINCIDDYIYATTPRAFD